MPEPTAAIADFLVRATNALGLSLTPTIEPLPDGWRIDLAGEGGDVLLRRRGEALTALQHIVEAAYRKDLDGRRVHLDCLNFRKDKDTELRQMAKYLAGKAKETGQDQQIGPLNPYERRLVHLEIAEDPRVTSESIGDAHMKTVIISVRTSS
jgi:spoIIIJ-associated protein